jgi:hypothetical protein
LPNKILVEVLFAQLTVIPRSSFEDFTVVVLNDVMEEKSRNATDIYLQSSERETNKKDEEGIVELLLL